MFLPLEKHHLNCYNLKYIKGEKRVEQIEGVLAEIIYQNEVNSYVVGILETEDEVCDDKECHVHLEHLDHEHHHHH